MGIGSFFSKLGQGIRKVGGKIGNGIRNTIGFIGKIAKPASHVISAIGGGLSKLPGTIGTIGNAIHKGFGIANKFLDLLPDSKVKEKLKEGSDSAEATFGKYEENVNDIGRKIGAYDKFVGAVGDGIGKLGDMANRSYI